MTDEQDRAAHRSVDPTYPRPRLVRDRWTSLDGVWDFRVGPLAVAAPEHFSEGWPAADTLRIRVPFAPQASLSEVADEVDKDDLDTVWYRRTVDRPANAGPADEVLLHIGACDQQTTVWIDDTMVGEHQGGNLPFSVPVGDELSGIGHVLTIRSVDRNDQLDVPRGKQFWRPIGEGIFYTPTTGIWQSVWLEPVPRNRIADVHVIPEIGTGTVRLIVSTVGDPVAVDRLAARVTFEGEPIAEVEHSVRGVAEVAVVAHLAGRHLRISGDDVIDAGAVVLWSPERPALYDLELRLLDGDGVTIDLVRSYFGMRQVEIRDGYWCLNGRPYEQRLVLDQGYWPDGVMTAPDPDSLRRDVELAKALGYNGVRKHQKVEDPRFLYWADRLGLLVWAELPSGYRFSEHLVRRATAELGELILRDRSHPCIVAWVPLNESWGVPGLATDPRQRAFADSLYHLAHALDGTRPVVGNDGWEHCATDLITVHNYESASAVAANCRTAPDERWNAGRTQFVGDARDRGQPQLVSEFGGIKLGASGSAWGYDTAADGDELVRRYAELVGAVRAAPRLQGFCWTQLTDVESERNGILTADRRPKVDVPKWCAVTQGRELDMGDPRSG